MRLSEKVTRALSQQDYVHIDAGFLRSLLPQINELEIKLAEYENDETARRRADAHRIRDLSGRIDFLIEHFTDNNEFTFPDGDTWRVV